MPTATAYRREAEYPEYPVLCRALAGEIVKARRVTRTTGDAMIARYDAFAGAQATRDREAELATWLTAHVSAKPAALSAIRKRIPMADRPQAPVGAKSPKIQSQIRSMSFEGWPMERLLAALDACGMECGLLVRPKAPA